MPALARALAARGEQVVVFEGETVGGSCVNVGCTPTKSLRASARMAHMARRAADFGVAVGAVRVDFRAVMERAHGIVLESRGGLQRSLEKAEGLTFIHERAGFDAREGEQFVVRSASTRVVAPRVYLNTGTRPFVPDIPGLDTVPSLTNASILQLTECPAHLIVVGGSYIGLEFAQIFRRLGSEVTVIEAGPSIAAREDDDVSDRIATMLRDEGITILTGHAIERVAARGGENDADGVLVTVRPQAGGAPRAVRGSHTLIATGRLPNSDSLGLASVGVKRDDRGFIPVDGGLETNVPGVWALGDVNRRGAFTHTSYQDHEIVLANYLGGARSVDGRVMTYALYTDPPLGRVGITEREARELQKNGRHFLVVTEKKLLVYDTATGKVTTEIALPPSKTGASCSGVDAVSKAAVRVLNTYEVDPIQIFDLKTEVLTRTLQSPFTMHSGLPATLQDVMLSSNARLAVASRGDEQSIVVWDTDSGSVIAG
ncbi:MAG: FAD-dependent oxidoreductase, partial [Gemmatimonadota bacterium]